MADSFEGLESIIDPNRRARTLLALAYILDGELHGTPDVMPDRFNSNIPLALSIAQGIRNLTNQKQGE